MIHHILFTNCLPTLKNKCTHYNYRILYKIESENIFSQLYFCRRWKLFHAESNRPFVFLVHHRPVWVYIFRTIKHKIIMKFIGTNQFRLIYLLQDQTSTTISHQNDQPNFTNLRILVLYTTSKSIRRKSLYRRPMHIHLGARGPSYAPPHVGLTLVLGGSAPPTPPP